MLPCIAAECTSQHRDEVGPEPSGLDVFSGAVRCDDSGLFINKHPDRGGRCSIKTVHLNLDANLEIVLRDAVGESAVTPVDAGAAVKNLDIAVVAEQDTETVRADDPRVF